MAIQHKRAIARTSSCCMVLRGIFLLAWATVICRWQGDWGCIYIGCGGTVYIVFRPNYSKIYGWPRDKTRPIQSRGYGTLWNSQMYHLPEYLSEYASSHCGSRVHGIHDPHIHVPSHPESWVWRHELHCCCFGWVLSTFYYWLSLFWLTHVVMKVVRFFFQLFTFTSRNTVGFIGSKVP